MELCKSVFKDIPEETLCCRHLQTAEGHVSRKEGREVSSPKRNKSPYIVITSETSVFSQAPSRITDASTVLYSRESNWPSQRG